MQKVFLQAIVLCFLVSCAGTGQKFTSTSTAGNPREYQIGAYLWVQTSGEYRALTYQAYNLARAQVERDLENKHNKKRAVVLDIDETILDNSFGGADDIKNGRPWHEGSFYEWVKLQKAVAIPGALEFANFLVEHGVEIILISNRKQWMMEDTYANLRALNFPVKKENILLDKGEYSKESRRREVLKKFHVVLLLGDNLVDFHQGFDDLRPEERSALVDNMQNEFGQKYIVLPNPLYGDWEKSLPRDRERIELLKTKL